MPDEFGPVRNELASLIGGALSDRSLPADTASLFLLDANGSFAFVDRELEGLLGARDGVRVGDAFHPEALVPSNRVALAIAHGLAGRVPEACFVVAHDHEHAGVWQFEAIPVTSPHLAGGRGVLCRLSREPDPHAKAVVETGPGMTLNERLEHERLEATQAVAVTMRHEINNALTSLIGNAELILRRTDGFDDATVARVKEILRQGRRIQKVLDRLESLTEVRTTTYYGGVRMIELGGEAARGDEEGPGAGDEAG